MFQDLLHFDIRIRTHYLIQEGVLRMKYADIKIPDSKCLRKRVQTVFISYSCMSCISV